MDIFDNTAEVFNPIKGMKSHTTTLGQLVETQRVVQEIIGNLDEGALFQMYEGSDRDLDNLLEIMYTETYKTVYGDLGIVRDSTFLYLDKLTETVEETFRIENINYFIASVMPEFDMDWYHLEWGQFVMMYNRLAILAARDLGKSYYFSNAYPTWKMYRYQVPPKFGRNTRPDLALSHRGFIVTNSEDLGIDLLEIMKTNIENNGELAKRLLPEGDNKRGWGQKSIKAKNGARLGIKSYGGAFRGRHPGYIVVDDFLKDNVIYSETQRQKAIDWFHSVLMNAVSKHGQVPVVGTPFHALDLYGDLKTKKRWRAFEYPAIYPDGRVTAPRRYNYQDIMNKREEQGNLIFSREILVRPIVSDSTIFPFEILRRAFVGMDEFTLVGNRESYKMKFNIVVTGADFAMSSNVGADYSVFLTWGISEANEMYLMHVWRAKGASYLEQINVLKNINFNFRPNVMVLEANQFQQIFVEEADRQGLPVIPHVTTAANKHDLKKGLPGLAIRFQRMKIKLPRGDEYSINTTDMMCGEFSSIAFTDKGLESVAGHDDMAMATWMSDIAIRNVTTGVLGFLES